MTTQDGPSMSLRVLRPILEIASALGATHESFAAHLELPEDLDSISPDHRVPASRIGRGFEQLGEALGDPNIGLTLADALPTGSVSLLDLAAGASVTLRVLLQRLTRFYGVFGGGAVLTLEEQGEEAQLRWSFAASGRARSLVEFLVAVPALRTREAVGPRMKLTAVDFVHPAPPDTAAHTALFRAPIRFGQDADRLIFAASLLEAPLLTADALISNQMEKELVRLEGMIGADQFLTRVQAAIRDALTQGDPSLDATATALHMSSRTLQRHLAERGTTHQSVVDAARFARLQELLRHGGSVASIASSLGFGDPAAFYRAFRRWTGQTFAEYRERFNRPT